MDDGLAQERAKPRRLLDIKKTHPESGSVELSNDISIIALGAIATSLEKGYLKLGFEFEGWESYLDDKKAKQNTVLK